MKTTKPTGDCNSSDPGLDDMARLWGGGLGRFFFPAFWLVYLGQTIDGVSKYSHGAGAVVGYLIVAAFAACYLIGLPMGWTEHLRLFWAMFALAILLTVAESFFARGDALVFCVYLAVLAVASRSRYTFPGVVALALVTALAPRFVPHWGGQIDWNDGLTVFLVALAMFGFFKIIQSNFLLAAARAEVARLAAENERSRIARDLHDLLGHSLTTITVKAGLARRLSTRDPERAAVEIAEVEVLTRRTLGEVRAAVSGYRDITLAGELASTRALLHASGIEAALPGAIDIVDSDAVEPLAWVLREAVTNVVRHSRAARCTVTVGPRWIEIIDDGRGGPSAPGNGLTGLVERLETLGGTVEAGGCAAGWRVRAEMSSVSSPREAAVSEPTRGVAVRPDGTATVPA
jgi:two-component system sensor histidine kinase DesK